MQLGQSFDISVYRSGLYPDGRSRRAVFGIEIVRPLSFTMLPVMIATLVAMLQGFSVLWVLYIGFPAALVLAFFWTWLRLRGQICEILISDEKVAFRSIFDAAEPSLGQQWKLLIDMRYIPGGISLTVGLEEFSLFASDWPDWSRLIEHLGVARNHPHESGLV